jgi:hypothetical protein
MPPSSHGDHSPAAAGETDSSDDVGDSRTAHDQLRMSIDVTVPDSASVVISRIARRKHLAG